MTRVHERHASAGSLAVNRHRRADQKSKASYKIILEEVADKQKKLKTVVCGLSWAPRRAVDSDICKSYIPNKKLLEAIRSFPLETRN